MAREQDFREDVTVGMLIDRLSDFNQDLPVRLAHQPAWPMEMGVGEIVEVDVNKEPDDVASEPWDNGSQEEIRVVYLAESSARNGYLCSDAIEQLGWGR
jgi:hypothetical protein